jgi:hypothetical protein
LFFILCDDVAIASGGLLWKAVMVCVGGTKTKKL